jgi:hypothetical protein
MWLGEGWNFLKGLFNGEWIHGRVEKDPSYDLAAKFSDGYEPKAGRDYKWVLDYSIKEYEQASLRVESLDSKADTLIGYLGAGSGLVSIGLAYGLGNGRVRVLIAAVPVLLLLLGAILLALMARVPSKFPTLPYAKYALEQMETGTDQRAIGKLAAYVWTSTRSIALSTREKARLIRWAYGCFWLGIAWIVLSSVLSSLFH